MSTLFPALCSKAFSSLRKHVRILPKCTLFFFSLHFPCQVEARSTLSQINGKYSLKGKGLKDGLDLRLRRGGEVTVLTLLTDAQIARSSK